MPAISIRDLNISYGPVTAVDGLTLTVEPGQVMGLLGGNGAGKSSTLRAISGVNPHTGGTLCVAGYDMGDAGEAELARSEVGYCPDVGGLMGQATVREHIAVALAFRDQSRLWPQALEMVDRFDLAHVLDRVTGGFSHGMSRRTSVLLAALTAQSVLVLDEPFDGVDPLGVEATIEVIREAKAAGLAVLISTHLLDLVVASCDDVAVVVGGRVVATGPADGFAGPEGHARYAELLRAGA